MLLFLLLRGLFIQVHFYNTNLQQCADAVSPSCVGRWTHAEDSPLNWTCLYFVVKNVNTGRVYRIIPVYYRLYLVVPGYAFY